MFSYSWCSYSPVNAHHFRVPCPAGQGRAEKSTMRNSSHCQFIHRSEYCEGQNAILEKAARMPPYPDDDVRKER